MSIGHAQTASGQIPSLPVPQCFGVNVHFNDDQLPVEIEYLKNLGVGWIRRDMFWADVEKTRGTYDFSKYDRIIDSLHNAGFHLMIILDYSNPNYDVGKAPFAQKDRDAFSRYAYSAAARYKGKVDVWEIYNEPNNPEFWKPKPDAAQYVGMADIVTASIHDADPNAIVVGPALAGPFIHDAFYGKMTPTYAYLDRVFNSYAARSWGAITFHPYRAPNETPESAILQVEATHQLMRQHDLDWTHEPLIAGEWGYSTFKDGVSEEMQAAYAVRSFLVAGMEHMPFSIWYDWQDDGPDTSNREHNFGLIHYYPHLPPGKEDVLAKPAYTAVKQLGTLLAGYHFDVTIQNDDSIMVQRYLKGRNEAFIAWSADNSPHSVNLALPAGTWSVNHILADTKQQTVAPGQAVSFNLDKMPIIILPVAIPAAAPAPAAPPAH